MNLNTTAMRTSLARFWRHEDGVATVDWVMLCCGATGAAVFAMNLSQDNLGTYSNNVRTELQSPYFDTGWTTGIDVPDPAEWGTGEDIVSTYDPNSAPNQCLGGHWNANGGCSAQGGGSTGGTTTSGGTTGGGTTGGGTTGGGTTGGGTTGGGTTGGGTTGGGTTTGGGSGGGTTTTASNPSGRVVGCPTDLYQGDNYTRTGHELTQADLNVMVNAGGATHLSACPGVPFSTGYFSANPDFTLFLSGMDGLRELEIETRDSTCDTVLLMRDPTGQWHLNDDGGPGYQSKLKFLSSSWNMSRFNGQIDIWVGTWGGNDCVNRIEVDTFY